MIISHSMKSLELISMCRVVLSLHTRLNSLRTSSIQTGIGLRRPFPAPSVHAQRSGLSSGIKQAQVLADTRLDVLSLSCLFPNPDLSPSSIQYARPHFCENTLNRNRSGLLSSLACARTLGHFRDFSTPTTNGLRYLRRKHELERHLGSLQDERRCEVVDSIGPRSCAVNAVSWLAWPNRSEELAENLQLISSESSPQRKSYSSGLPRNIASSRIRLILGDVAAAAWATTREVTEECVFIYIHALAVCVWTAGQDLSRRRRCRR